MKNTKENIEIVMDFLEKNRIQILSTTYKNKPISRPIGSAMLAKNRIWYCMNNDKPMFMQLKENPMICICACAKDYSWIRIHAESVFIDDLDVKKQYLERGTSSFKDIHDLRFATFYLNNANVELHKQGKTEYYLLP